MVANLHADVVDERVQVAVREPPEGLHAVGALGVTLVLEPHHIWKLDHFWTKSTKFQIIYESVKIIPNCSSDTLTGSYCIYIFWASPTCIYGLPDGPEPLRVVVVVEEEPAAEVLVGRPRRGRLSVSLPESVVPTQELTVDRKIYVIKHITFLAIVAAGIELFPPLKKLLES